MPNGLEQEFNELLDKKHNINTPGFPNKQVLRDFIISENDKKLSGGSNHLILVDNQKMISSPLAYFRDWIKSNKQFSFIDRNFSYDFIRKTRNPEVTIAAEQFFYAITTSNHKEWNIEYLRAIGGMQSGTADHFFDFTTMTKIPEYFDNQELYHRRARRLLKILKLLGIIDYEKIFGHRQKETTFWWVKDCPEELKESNKLEIQTIRKVKDKKPEKKKPNDKPDLHCFQCNEDWTPRKDNPTRCAKCNSRRWNKPKIIPKSPTTSTKTITDDEADFNHIRDTVMEFGGYSKNMATRRTRKIIKLWKNSNVSLGYIIDKIKNDWDLEKL